MTSTLVDAPIEVAVFNSSNTPVTTYTPGQQYTVTVTLNSADFASRRVWGFELTVLNEAGGVAGTLANNSNLTQILNELGRSYIEHTEAGTFSGQQGGAQWNFKWTAPSSNIGNIVFYAAGNQGDNNGAEDGDPKSASRPSPCPMGWIGRP